jgi:predicted RNase H-like nuclease (RuvC/YqgF family)
LEKFEEANQEYKRHISLLERSIEEHKRLVRKREKELEQVKNEFEHNMLNASSLNNKVFYIFFRLEKNFLSLDYSVYKTRCRNEYASYGKYFIK